MDENMCIPPRILDIIIIIYHAHRLIINIRHMNEDREI